MTIQQLIRIIFCISIIASVSVLSTFSYHFILQDFIQLELASAVSNKSKLDHILDNELDSFLGYTLGWATWDDTYYFVQKPNQYYIDSNYNNSSIFGLKANIVIIANKENKILLKSFYDYDNNKILAPDLNMTQVIQEKMDSQKIYNSKVSKSGYFVFNKKAYLYVNSPILPSTKEAPANGSIFFARELSDLYMKSLSKLLQYPLDPPIITASLGMEQIINDDAKKNLIITKVLKDDFSEKGIEFNFFFPKKITKKGKTTILFFILSTAFILVLITLFSYILLDQIIFKKLIQLAQRMRTIGGEGLQTKRLELDGIGEIATLTKDINQMLERLSIAQIHLNRSSKMSALGEMAGNIAHEINNPLTIIQNYSKYTEDLLANESIDREKIKSNLSKIDETVKRISTIIKSLRMISRDSMTDPLQLTQISYIMDETMHLCKNKILNSKIDLQIQGPMEMTFKTQVVSMIQVLLNLISNSIDAIEHLPNKWIRVEWKKEYNHLFIIVTDSGPGISPEIVEKMMQAFYTTKKVGKGTGLGLSISQNIIELLSGSLTYNSSHPNTQFIIKLPLKN